MFQQLWGVVVETISEKSKYFEILIGKDIEVWRNVRLKEKEIIKMFS